MKREMNLQDYYFNKIKDGSKTVEIRLYDVKRRALKIGNIIIFNNRETGERIECLIKDLKYYDNLDLLLEAGDISETKEDILKFYTEEEIEKYGLIAIYIELMK